MSCAALSLAWPLQPRAPLAAADRLLGELRFGVAPGAAVAPVIDVATAPLWPADGWRMAWLADTPVRAAQRGTLRYRCAGDLLFGTLSVDEADFAPTTQPGPAGESALQRAACHAYHELFAVLDEAGYPGLVRAWNYLPRINAVEHGIERYRQFNIGRQQAFAAAGRALIGAVPAACALGVQAGPLSLAFLASRRAPRAIENPRQVSAYHYPQQYGPRSPTFSRATLLETDGGPLLFISGTASIVGHRSLHEGDVAAQTAETLANIDAVLAEAARVAPQARFGAADLALVAYVRHAQDVDAVRAVVESRLGAQAAVTYVQADICRADLLVEIEASAGHPNLES